MANKVGLVLVWRLDIELGEVWFVTSLTTTFVHVFFSFLVQFRTSTSTSSPSYRIVWYCMPGHSH